jgi:hypothetical protein
LRSLDPKFDFVVFAIEESKEVDKLMVDELMSSLQPHEQKIVKRNEDKAIKHALQSKLSLKEDRYDQGETSTYGYTIRGRGQQRRGGSQRFQGRGSRIQDSEEEVVETPPEEAGDNKDFLLEEEEAVTITMTRGISSVIVAINLGTIALNVEGKLH